MRDSFGFRAITVAEYEVFLICRVQSIAINWWYIAQFVDTGSLLFVFGGTDGLQSSLTLHSKSNPSEVGPASHCC